ncbi:MAG: HDIG domain-containing protein [Eubacteriales bacterium]|nr:HDIG domain-containing protein [Eubacteriales bacterium]
MRFPVPEPVLGAIGRLNSAGHEAYLVGGCVRDDYLGIPPHDYDICTSAYPDEILNIFSQEKTLTVGKAHGTITVILNSLPIEITTYRADGPYRDGRHPDYVSFTNNLAEDLKRRDFTMNALVWHPKTGIKDLFGGREDCDKQIIRCIGSPAKRFTEDALRILRALRFASTFSFTVEKTAVFAMLDKKDMLKNISVERVALELNKLMTGARPAEVFSQHPRILFTVLPLLEPSYHCAQRSVFHSYDVWEHTLRALSLTPPDLAVRWATLFHDSGKPHTVTYDPDGTTHFRGHQTVSVRLVRETMQALKQSNSLTKTVSLLVAHHDDRIGPDNLQVWLSKLGPDLFFKLMHVQRADLLAHAPHVAKRVDSHDALVKKAEELIANGACLSLGDLAIDGKTLIENGFDSGPFLGETLNFLLERVINGFEQNDRQSLLASALKRLEERKKQLKLQ